MHKRRLIWIEKIKIHPMYPASYVLKIQIPKFEYLKYWWTRADSDEEMIRLGSCPSNFYPYMLKYWKVIRLK